MIGPIALLTSDWHLMDNHPECRSDDTDAVQMDKLQQICAISEEYGVPVIGAGDIVDKWNVSHKLVVGTMRALTHNVVAIPGQHDLPQHSLDLQEKSAYAVLLESGKIQDLTSFKPCLMFHDVAFYGFPFGVEPTPPDPKDHAKFHVAIAHTMCYHKDPPYPGAPETGIASEVMKRFAGYDVVVCGDNHHGFTVRYKSGRILVNCGTTFRAEADMADYKPKVWLLRREEDALEIIPMELKVADGVVTRDHLDEQKAREDRTEAFVQKVRGSFKVGLSFKDNLCKALAKIKPNEAVKKLIDAATEKK